MSKTTTAASAGSVVLLAAAGWYSLVHTRSVQPLPPVEPLVITTQSIPDAICGQPYHAVIQASGGRKPYMFRVAPGMGEIPNWLTLETVNDEGVLSGTAPAPGADGACGGPYQVAGLTLRTKPADSVGMP